MSIFPDLPSSADKETDPSILKIQAEVKMAISGPINVYYPGIGGGEEPVDPTSPFEILNADYVFGIDPFEHPSNIEDLSERKTNYNFGHIEKDILELVAKTGEVTNIIKEENETTLKYSFSLYGKTRTLEIFKIPTDGERYIPTTPFNVIYSRRTVGVVENLPVELYQRAKAIYFKGEISVDARAVQRAGEEHGFRNIDLVNLTGDRENFYRSTLLVK